MSIYFDYTISLRSRAGKRKRAFKDLSSFNALAKLVADIYTRRAWDLDSQYTDLVNYINLRKGTIYMGTGTIVSIISTAPQMAIMNIGSDSFEKLVMLENSSKTTWTVGTKYKIFGDAYGLYDTMR